MRFTGLADLKRLSDAAFQKEQQTLRPYIEAEAEILQKLSRLDAQLQQTRQNSGQADGYQVTGTDVLWRGWEEATRRKLNTDLARVRAQKLTKMQALRKAFGRKQALGQLIEEQQKARRDMLMKKRSRQ